MCFQFVQEQVQLPSADAPYIAIGHLYYPSICSTVFSDTFYIYDMTFMYAYKLVGVKYVFKIFQRFGNHHFLHILFMNDGIVTICLQGNNFIYFQKIDAAQLRQCDLYRWLAGRKIF